MTLLIHFDACQGADCAEKDGTRAASSWLAHAASWYWQWAGRCAQRVFVLLPEQLNGHAARFAGRGEHVSPLWYTPDGLASLPSTRQRGKVWVLNGRQLPVVDWDAARSEVRRNGTDVLMFGWSHEAAGRYCESVDIDETRGVVRFRRHYSDSPRFSDPWQGEASFLVVSGRNALSAVNHVLARGWNLDSIGALTRRLSVRWSSSSCVAGPFGFSAPPGTVLDFGNGGNGNGTSRAARRTGGNGRVTSLTERTTPPGSRRGYLFFKRLLDMIASALGLIVLSPLLLLVAILVKCSSRGPVLFVHRRQGLGGKEFPCLKFRSMCDGADAMQRRLRCKNEVDGPQFKIVRDPRLTRIGNWLRRYNVDELPQLINVLLGHMSLVGPRPSPDDENQLCPAWRRARLSVRPGITGLWQVLRVRGPHTSDFQEWIYYDIQYARHRSFWLDLQLLFYTPATMFAPHRLGRFRTRLERRGICRRWVDPIRVDMNVAGR